MRLLCIPNFYIFITQTLNEKALCKCCGVTLKRLSQLFEALLDLTDRAI